MLSPPDDELPALENIELDGVGVGKAALDELDKVKDVLELEALENEVELPLDKLKLVELDRPLLELVLLVDAPDVEEVEPDDAEDDELLSSPGPRTMSSSQPLTLPAVKNTTIRNNLRTLKNRFEVPVFGSGRRIEL